MQSEQCKRKFSFQLLTFHSFPGAILTLICNGGIMWIWIFSQIILNDTEQKFQEKQKKSIERYLCAKQTQFTRSFLWYTSISSAFNIIGNRTRFYNFKRKYFASKEIKDEFIRIFKSLPRNYLWTTVFYQNELWILLYFTTSDYMRLTENIWQCWNNLLIFLNAQNEMKSCVRRPKYSQNSR